jgi:putative endonuclease
MTVPQPPKRPTARQQLGARGERLAAAALEQAGYRILAPTGLRTKSGQIDLLAEEGGDLVFIEVKTRRSTAYGIPAEAVNAAKQRHLITAALEYLAAQGQLDHPWRIDVVAIVLTAAGPEIEIIRHAVESLHHEAALYLSTARPLFIVDDNFDDSFRKCRP